MADPAAAGNPIFYAQFNLRGGWRNTLIYSVGYFILIGAAMWISAAYPSNHTVDVLGGWLHGLLALQLLTLVVYGSLRVSSAVRADMSGGAIESHRLMPMSPMSAAFGYLLGAPAQGIALAVVNFILGSLALDGAGVPFQRWLVANFMIGAFALMIWAISANIAFSSRGGFAVVLVGIIVSAFTNGLIMSLVPGLGVLTCPIITRSVFDLSGSAASFSFAFAAALIGQFMIGAICVLSAANKYRSVEGVGLTPALGLLLVLAWVAISVVGIKNIREFTFPYMNSEPASQFTATVIATLFISLIPLSGTARAGVLWAHGDSNSRGKPVSLIWVIVAVTAFTCVLMLVHPRLGDEFQLQPLLAETAAQVLIFAVTMGLLFHAVYLTGVRGWIVATPWILLTWGLPLVADMVQSAMNNSGEMGMISTISPIGAVIKIWKPDPQSALRGLLIQTGLALVPMLLVLRLHMRRRRRTLPPPLP